MIEQIQNLEQFGFWVVGYRAALLEDPSVTHVDISQTPCQNVNVSGSPPYLFLIGNPWDTLPDTLQERLKLQYESAKTRNPESVHLYISPRRLHFKAVSPDVVEREEYCIDRVGEYRLLKAGLTLEFPGDIKTGWNIFKDSIIDKSAEDSAIHIIIAAIFDKGYRRRDSIRLPRIKELQELARFMDRTRDKAVICP